MEELIHHLPEILLHTLVDTLKIVPFLFLTYLFMEFLEHKSGDLATNMLKASGRIGPLAGSLLGAFPQCGFSAAAVGLYTGRIITTGTLLAIWLSTSDEMLPILISGGAPLALIVKIVIFKIAVGMVAGFALDLVSFVIRKRKNSTANTPCIEEFCEREGCRCNEHFFISALRHTVSITIFVLFFTLVLNLIIHGVGEDKLATLVLDRKILGNLLAGMVGLIPNCAASIALTKLYLGGVISIGAMLSGLLVGAGVGIALLFRNNRPLRDTVRVVAILWCIGALAGILVDLTPLGMLF